MQNIAVHIIGSQMLKRTGHGLRNLVRETSFWIIRQPMVLPWLRGKFRLQKKVGPRHDSRSICHGQPLAHSSFKVMLALVGRINSAKARANGQLSKRRGAIFFPGGAVKKGGCGYISRSWHAIFYLLRHLSAKNTTAQLALAELVDSRLRFKLGC